MSPLFTHDCAACKPLGQHAGQDLYFCEQGGSLPTVIARYGNEGHEYTSGLALSHYVDALGVAKSRAVEAGLLP